MHERRKHRLANRHAASTTQASGTQNDEPAPQAASKTLIFHYHLFKNAGTSVDEMLKRNFGSRWMVQEFRGPPRNIAGAVREFLKGHSDFDAISSHTALLPTPNIDGLTIFPIIFLRHPIDRIRSAYEFERRQDADTAGARLAKRHDLAGYVKELLRNHHLRQVRNFQTHRLAQYEPQKNGAERVRALRALKALPFVGVVELYDRSMERLEILLRPIFPNFRAEAMHKNITRTPGSTLEERLESIKAQLGEELYDRFCAANEDDAILHRRLSKRILNKLT